jgi:pimeloyl-ACP methyl ester carboxylesterase
VLRKALRGIEMELESIPQAAHSPQLENPAAWSAAIRAHLSRVR